MVHFARKDLMGTWTDEGSEHALFEIRNDSIYYVDHFTSYKYLLVKDTILIQYPDWTFRGRWKIRNSRLEIISENGLARFKRWKD